MIMKSLSLAITFGVLALLSTSCQSEETSLYTGREVRYPLIEGSLFDQETAGTLIARERNDQSVEVIVDLSGTSEQAVHPVHLHFGSLGEDQPVAAWLSPLEDMGDGKSQSITRLDHLHNDDPLTFDLFTEMDGSVKIHFEESGQWEDVILGATNIGRNYDVTDATRYQDIATCNGRTNL